MFVANKKFTREWEMVTEAATGDTFAIQPLLKDIEYIVLNRQPIMTERGGVIPAQKQLLFKKVSGDLYLRDPDGLGASVVNIERIEE